MANCGSYIFKAMKMGKNLIKIIFSLWNKYRYTFILYLFVCIVVVNEFIIFYIYKYSWPATQCGDSNDYHKILFVADPQILGETNESWISRWDSDRFLRKTYKSVLEHSKPSVVIFLGDLMDEGNIATFEQYSRYFKRFKWIFKPDTVRVNLTIFLPGDNDIGGENEDINYNNVERFKKYFGSSRDIENYSNMDIYKVNKLLGIYPEPRSSYRNNTIRIVVSHLPVLGYPDALSERVMRKVRPHVIFSGHDHKSFHFVGDFKTGRTTFVELTVNKKHSSTWRFQASKVHTNELTVPTCSYRMGVQKIGYGMATIDRNGEYFCYQIFWIPQRLGQLKIYLFICCIIIVCLVFISLLRFYKCLCNLRKVLIS